MCYLSIEVQMFLMLMLYCSINNFNMDEIIRINLVCLMVICVEVLF